MTYLRIYTVDEKCHTRFVHEVDYDSKIGQSYLARAVKTVPSNKQKDTMCVYVKG